MAGADQAPDHGVQSAAREALDLLATKLAADEAALGVEFPVVTGPDGRWTTAPASE
jgi:unsaturated chondroitin disaccharide hydrolase